MKPATQPTISTRLGCSTLLDAYEIVHNDAIRRESVSNEYEEGLADMLLLDSLDCFRDLWDTLRNEALLHPSHFQLEDTQRLGSLVTVLQRNRPDLQSAPVCQFAERAALFEERLDSAMTTAIANRRKASRNATPTVSTTSCQPENAKPKTRTKREVAELEIAVHLKSRPHDTVKEVARAVRCSVGVVSESKAWKLNRRRLKVSHQSGTDPRSVRLNTKAVNAVAGNAITQVRHHRQEATDLDATLDEQENTLFSRIGEYRTVHPDATDGQTAVALGCGQGDVERWHAKLSRLTAEQQISMQEDAVPTRGAPQRRVPHRV